MPDFGTDDPRDFHTDRQATRPLWPRVSAGLAMVVAVWLIGCALALVVAGTYAAVNAVFG